MTPISTSRSQSQRLIDCGVDPKTADMSLDMDTDYLYLAPWKDRCHRMREIPAWSLSALLSMLPRIIDKDWWLDIAPVDFGDQWSIGYYNADKPRTIKVLTHNADIIECAVRMIEYLASNGYKLNEIEK